VAAAPSKSSFIGSVSVAGVASAGSVAQAGAMVEIAMSGLGDWEPDNNILWDYRVYIVSEAIQVYHSKLVELWDDAL